MTKKADSFIVTVDDNNEYNVVEQLELDKYSLKANVDPATHSKQVPALSASRWHLSHRA